MLTFYTDISQAFEAANRIRSMRPQANPESTPSAFNLYDAEGHEKDPQGVKVELKNVVFRYPTRDVPVLKSLNMTVSNLYQLAPQTLIYTRLRVDNSLLS